MESESINDVAIRPYQTRDRDDLIRLAPRLLVGMAPWRNLDACRAAVQQWVDLSLNRDPSDGKLFVATDGAGVVVGFVSVERTRHFSGEAEACLGELVVDERTERHGVGRMLVEVAGEWALERGYPTLTLVTGAANQQARGFYRHLGFREEEVRLTKLLVAG